MVSGSFDPDNNPGDFYPVDLEPGWVSFTVNCSSGTTDAWVMSGPGCDPRFFLLYEDHIEIGLAAEFYYRYTFFCQD